MLEYTRFIRKKVFQFRYALMLLIPLLCILLLLTQTVFAKNTYLINDSGRIVVHTTYTTNPAVVLNEAGLHLGKDDTYTTQQSNGVSEITIQRKQIVTIHHGGKWIEAVSYGETIESLLARLNISLSPEDVVSLPLDTYTYEGMELFISHSVQSTETYTSSIPYETIYCYDATLPAGTQVVLTEGVNGQLLSTATVCYLNGQEISRSVTEESVVLHPVNALIAIGTGAITEEAPVEQPQVVIPGTPVIGDGMIITGTGEILTYTGSLEVKASAYTQSDPGCNSITATGTIARVGAIAVDPSVIPYGTRMFIVSNDGKYIYGIATAEDCGGAIKGNKIDLYFDTVTECLQFGRRNCTVYFLG